MLIALHSQSIGRKIYRKDYNYLRYLVWKPTGYFLP